MRLTDEALADIQGVITSGYRHLPQAAYLFVRMTDLAGARRWLSRISASITTSRRWPVERASANVKPQSAINVGITAAGCARADCPLGTVHLPFGVPGRHHVPGAIAYSWRHRRERSGAVEIGGLRSDPVHALLLLFASDETNLNALCAAQRAILELCDGVVELRDSMQRGYRPETESEPFSVSTTASRNHESEGSTAVV